MNVVGLDLSLSATGFADADGARVVTCKKYSGTERLAHFRTYFAREFMDDQPDLVAVENYSFGSHLAHARSIAELGGVTRLVMFDMGIPWAEVPPTSLKLFATGKGNAGAGLKGYAAKLPMIQAALDDGAQLPVARTKRDGTVEYDDNAADAYWLRQMAITAQQVMDDNTAASFLREYELRAIEGVVWP